VDNALEREGEAGTAWPVPVLDGRGRLERATRGGVGAGCGAGKQARRFLAASSVSVIRVDPHHHRRICAPDTCRPRASVLAAAASGASVRAATAFRTAEAGRGRPVPVRRVSGRRRVARFRAGAPRRGRLRLRKGGFGFQ